MSVIKSRQKDIKTVEPKEEIKHSNQMTAKQLHRTMEF